MAYDKVVDSTVLDGYFSDIADAIRSKDGTQNTYTPAQMPQAIEDIPSGGMDPGLEALIKGNATGDVVVKGITNIEGISILIGSTHNAAMTSLELTDTIKLGKAFVGYNASEVFDGIKIFGNTTVNTLKTIRLPVCTHLSFTGNTSAAISGLEEIIAPNVQYATLFFYPISPITLNFPKLSICYGSLGYNSGLQGIDWPMASTIDAGLFSRATALTNVNLPLLKTVSANTFYECTGLSQIILPKVNTVQQYGFYGCSALTYCDLGGTPTTSSSNIQARVFQNCSNLKALVLRSTRLLSASYSGFLDGTPIASGTGYIYVPRDLVATYQAATNWSTYSAQFRALEDYTDDGTLTGEFIMPTA